MMCVVFAESAPLENIVGSALSGHPHSAAPPSPRKEAPQTREEEGDVCLPTVPLYIVKALSNIVNTQ